MSITQKKQLLCICGEICLLATLLTIGVNFKSLWWRPTTQRGFFCDDATLKYPYHEDTVSQTVLYAIGLYAPMFLILLNETTKFARHQRRRQSAAAGCGLREHISQLPRLLRPLYATMRQLLFGFAAERLIKNVGKQTVGRLRPYFLAVCRPQFPDGSTCEASHNQGVYLEEYTCRGGNTASMHLSFPSGHASLAFYGATFALFYLQRQTHRSLAVSLRQLLQLLCVLCAWFVALSRVVDYKHHWSDVLAGAVLGASSALAVTMWCRADDSDVASLDGGSTAAGQELNGAELPMKVATAEAVNSLDLCEVKVLADK